MAISTVREQVRISTALLADFSNAIAPFQKNVFIFAHQYTVANGDYVAGYQLQIDLDGAQEILVSDTKETITTTTIAIAHTVGAITAGAGRQGASILTAATNASSTSVRFFAIVRV